MSKELKVLLVEDSQEDSLLLVREIVRGGYKLEHQRVETAEGLRHALQVMKWDVVISDYRMPSFDALGALQVLHESGQDIPFIRSPSAACCAAGTAGLPSPSPPSWCTASGRPPRTW